MFGSLINKYKLTWGKFLPALSIVLTICIMLVFALGMSGCMDGLTGASGAGGSGDNPHPNSGTSGQLVIEKTSAVPVINGKSTLAGVYVYNSGDTPVNNISYRVTSEPGVAPLSLPGATSCRNLEPNTSCLVVFSTPAVGEFQSGSSMLIADYNGHSSQQLINYHYVDGNSASGVRFSDGITLFGTNDYATVYAFVGKGQSYRDVGFTSTNQSVGINNGLTNGRADLAANEVLPLEIKSSLAVTSDHVEIISFGGHADVNQQLSRALKDGELLTSALPVTITPQPVANLLLSTPPVLNATTMESATLTLLNNGLQNATAISVSSLDTNNLQVLNDGCSGTSLAAGSSCQFKVKLLNRMANGSANIAISYNNSLGNASYNQIVYYYNTPKYPFITMIPSVSTLNQSYNTTKTVTYTVANIGKTSWNNMNIALRNTLSATTATRSTASSCTNGANLAESASCTFVASITSAGSSESGYIYLQANGTSALDNSSYAFSSKGVLVNVTQGSSSIYVTSTTPQNNTTVNQTTPIVLSFNTPMLTPSLNSNNIKLYKVSDGSQVGLTLQDTSNNGQTVSFTVTGGSLSANTEYQIVINPSQIYNSNNVAMGTLPAQMIATFTTNSVAAPVVSGYLPANGTTVSPLTPLTVTFSQAMNAATLTSANVILINEHTDSPVNGYSVSYDSDSYTLSITGATLNNSTSYSLWLNESQIKNTNNVAISEAGMVQLTGFTTNSVTTPHLTTISPDNNATGVSSQASLSLQFDMPMNPATLTSSNITVTNVASATQITLGSPVYSNNNSKVTFSMSGLQAESIYKVTLNQSNIQSADNAALGVGDAYYYFEVASNARGFLVGGGNAQYLTIPFAGESPNYEFVGGSGFYQSQFTGVSYASDGSLIMAGYSSTATSSTKLATTNNPTIFRNAVSSTSAENTLYPAYSRSGAVMTNQITGSVVCLSNGMCNTGTANFGVGQSGGILHSDDNGKTWYQATIDTSALSANGAASTSVYKIISGNCAALNSCKFLAQRTSGSGGMVILSSTDGGQSWVANLNTGETGSYPAFFCGTSSKCILVSSTGNGKYSTNGGISWTNSTITNNLGGGVALYASYCDITGTYCMAPASNSAQALYSNNGGQNWTAFRPGATDGINQFLTGVAVNASGQFLIPVNESATGYAAIAVYNQNGSFAYKRTVINANSYKPGTSNSTIAVNALSCNGDNCVAVWVANGGFKTYVTYSSDGGNTWNNYSTSISLGTSAVNNVYMNFYAAWCNKSSGANSICALPSFTGAGLKTLNGGATWGTYANNSTGLTGLSCNTTGDYCVGVNQTLNSANQLLVSSSVSGVVNAVISGRTNINALRGVDCITGSTACVVVGESNSVGQIYRTTAYNSGSYITNITGGTPAGFYAVSCGAGGANNTCLAVGASGTFAKSTDGGLNWVVNNSIGFSSTFTGNAIHCDFNTCIVAGTDSANGGSGVAYRSTDGGTTWSQITGYSGLFGKALFNVKCANGYCIMASGNNSTIGTSTSGGLLWSRDGGASWFDLGVYVGNFPMPALAVYY